MSTTYERARYAIWNHASQQVNGTIRWRVTPKSKHVVGVVPPSALPGQVTVIRASDHGISVTLSDDQAALIAQWTDGLPPDVLRSTAETDCTISHTDPYLRIDPRYRVTSTLPAVGARVSVRIAAAVSSIGTLRKAHILITDVRLQDVAA